MPFGYYFGAASDESIDAAFARLSGVKGTDLRRVLQQYQGAIDAARKMVVAAPYAPAAWAARDAANALQYEIDSRAELKTSSPVPDWLLGQIRDHFKKLYASAGDLTFQAAPLLMVAGGAIPAMLLDPSLRPDLPSLVPTWVKVAGVAAGALVLFGVVRAIQVGLPTAARVAERRLSGVPSGRRRSRPRRRH